MIGNMRDSHLCMLLHLCCFLSKHPSIHDYLLVYEFLNFCLYRDLIEITGRVSDVTESKLPKFCCQVRADASLPQASDTCVLSQFYLIQSLWFPGFHSNLRHQLTIAHNHFIIQHPCTGTFINYVRVPREGEGWKNLYILLHWGGGSQTHSSIIFPKSVFYIRNRAVKFFWQGSYFIYLII